MPARIRFLLLAGWLAPLLCGCWSRPAEEPRAAAPATQGVPPAGEEPHGVRFAESRFFRQPDLFLPTDDPAVVSADEATFLADEDEVLGFVVDGQPRAYSVAALSYHHVINDRIGDTPLAVTY